MSTWKKIVLCSADKEIFIVDEEVMLQAQTIKHMIEDGRVESEILVLDVDKKTLTKVIDYLTMHVHNKYDAPLKTWDVEFANVDPDTLYDLMIVSHTCIILLQLTSIYCFKNKLTSIYI